jgi:hypothetical protein
MRDQLICYGKGDEVAWIFPSHISATVDGDGDPEHIS